MNLLSRIKPKAEVATFDTGDWRMGDDLPDMPPDEELPIFHPFLNMCKVAEDQRQMDEWTEARDEETQYDIVQGVLYSMACPYKYAADYPRLVLPPSVREEVIKKSHEEVGHMAAIKTMRKVQEAYVLRGMKADIKGYVTNCPTCIVHRHKRRHEPMGKIPLATAPAQIIGVDLIGPFVKSPQGNAYVLTIIDHCTGWAEAYPIPRKTNEEVWKKFRLEYFPRHGYVDILVSDRGIEFNARAFDDYLRSVGLRHHKTTPYHPQSNGRTERFNRTLKDMLTKLVNNKRDHWEDTLGVALTAYNNATSDTTGHTPFFLHYGRHARLPLTMANNPLTPLDGRLQMLSEGLQCARNLTQKSRQFNRVRLARKATEGNLAVADVVVIRAQEPLTMTSKWDPQWQITQL